MVLILNEQSAWLYPPILTDSLKRNYPFQIACVQPPPPLPSEKNRKGVHVYGGGGDCTQASLRRMIHFLAPVWKRPTTKFPCPVFLMIQKGLYRTTVCRDLSLSQASLFRTANAFRVTWSERVFFPQVCHRNALTEIAWEDAVQALGMAMSTVASEKNRELLFISNVFYKPWHLSVLFHEYFEGTNPWKSQILIHSKKPDFCYGKKLGSSSDRRKWSLSLAQHLKGAWPNVRTESK